MTSCSARPPAPNATSYASPSSSNWTVRVKANCPRARLFPQASRAVALLACGRILRRRFGNSRAAYMFEYSCNDYFKTNCARPFVRGWTRTFRRIFGAHPYCSFSSWIGQILTVRTPCGDLKTGTMDWQRCILWSSRAPFYTLAKHRAHQDHLPLWILELSLRPFCLCKVDRCRWRIRNNY